MMQPAGYGTMLGRKGMAASPKTRDCCCRPHEKTDPRGSKKVSRKQIREGGQKRGRDSESAAVTPSTQRKQRSEVIWPQRPRRCPWAGAAPFRLRPTHHPRMLLGVQRAVCKVSPSPLRMIPLPAAPSSKIDGISRQEGAASRCPQLERLLLPQMPSSLQIRTEGL
jgi:hypothetical protein